MIKKKKQSDKKQSLDYKELLYFQSWYCIPDMFKEWYLCTRKPQEHKWRIVRFSF